MKAARPTEYQGVLFRSLSEAMFARGLHLAGYSWAYEPKNYSLKGWSPDFFVTPFIENEKHCVVEYKPAPITEIYKNFLSRRVARVQKKNLPEEDVLLPILVTGSFFDLTTPRSVELWAHHEEWYDMTSCWGHKFFPFWREAKRWRFDLK